MVHDDISSRNVKLFSALKCPFLAILLVAWFFLVVKWLVIKPLRGSQDRKIARVMRPFRGG